MKTDRDTKHRVYWHLWDSVMLAEFLSNREIDEVIKELRTEASRHEPREMETFFKLASALQEMKEQTE